MKNWYHQREGDVLVQTPERITLRASCRGLAFRDPLLFFLIVSHYASSVYDSATAIIWTCWNVEARDIPQKYSTSSKKYTTIIDPILELGAWRQFNTGASFPTVTAAVPLVGGGSGNVERDKGEFVILGYEQIMLGTKGHQTHAK